ncbi:hypothetical protein [Streptococcus marmotae]|nr:hypothetical protein [Streptococcus marmotae]
MENLFLKFVIYHKKNYLLSKVEIKMGQIYSCQELVEQLKV